MDLEKRFPRRAAAAYVTETYGFSLSARTLEDAPVPYIVVCGQSMYHKADLDSWAQAKIASAPRRIGRLAQRETIAA